MGFSSESHAELIESLKAIDTLVNFAQICEPDDLDKNRKLFLKLAVVLIVTRFQVFVEGVLKEFLEHITADKLNYENVPVFAKLNSMRIAISESAFENMLQNAEAYTPKKYNVIKSRFAQLNSHFESVVTIQNLKLKTTFPLGKTGANELVDLLKQFEGKNVFNEKGFDTDKLNSLLLTRHLIIHQDISQGVTEETVMQHRIYIEELSRFILNYLESFDNLVRV